MGRGDGTAALPGATSSTGRRNATGVASLSASGGSSRGARGTAGRTTDWELATVDPNTTSRGWARRPRRQRRAARRGRGGWQPVKARRRLPRAQPGCPGAALPIERPVWRGRYPTKGTTSRLWPSVTDSCTLGCGGDTLEHFDFRGRTNNESGTEPSTMPTCALRDHQRRVV